MGLISMIINAPKASEHYHRTASDPFTTWMELLPFMSTGWSMSRSHCLSGGYHCWWSISGLPYIPWMTGFGYCCPRTDGAYTTGLVWAGTMWGPQRHDLIAGDGICLTHCISAGYSGTFTGNDDSTTMSSASGESHVRYHIGVLSF